MRSAVAVGQPVSHPTSQPAERSEQPEQSERMKAPTAALAAKRVRDADDRGWFGSRGVRYSWTGCICHWGPHEQKDMHTQRTQTCGYMYYVHIRIHAQMLTEWAERMFCAAVLLLLRNSAHCAELLRCHHMGIGFPRMLAVEQTNDLWQQMHNSYTPRRNRIWARLCTRLHKKRKRKKQPMCTMWTSYPTQRVFVCVSLSVLSRCSTYINNTSYRVREKVPFHMQTNRKKQDRIPHVVSNRCNQFSSFDKRRTSRNAAQHCEQYQSCCSWNQCRSRPANVEERTKKRTRTQWTCWNVFFSCNIRSELSSSERVDLSMCDIVFLFCFYIKSVPDVDVFIRRVAHIMRK